MRGAYDRSRLKGRPNPRAKALKERDAEGRRLCSAITHDSVRLSVRTLREKIQGMLYERTGISRKPAELAKQELKKLREEDQLTPDLVFRDPYLLDFLGLKDTYSERGLESAILRELERFLVELGSDFAFLARQKRVTVDQEDYYIDLLFYHRRLRRLVAIDLKLGRLQAAGCIIDPGDEEVNLVPGDLRHRRVGVHGLPAFLLERSGVSVEGAEIFPRYPDAGG